MSHIPLGAFYEFQQTSPFLDSLWDSSVLATLVDYIRIPSKSPAFDLDWVKHGHIEKAVALFERWAREHIAKPEGATPAVVRPEGRLVEDL